MKIKEKTHRLPLNLYKGKRIASFTFCIKNREDAFTDNLIVKTFIKILKEEHEKAFCLNWAYVFMPDHLHVVSEGFLEKSDLWKMAAIFKKRTGFWFSKNCENIKWQKDFYDHIHRKDEDLKKQIKYIFENPLRKSLIQDWKDYKFAGSLNFRIEEIIE
jgi:REP element-mobilizing transposase RayT